MVNTAGASILVLIYNGVGGGSGITTHEFSNEASCRAAIVQLEPIRRVSGYCIAKDVHE